MNKIDFKRRAQELSDEFIDIRRELHRIPELSGEEYETQKFILDYLEKLGIEHSHSADTGVYAILRTGRPGRTVALRADMDALAVEEQTGLPFASIYPGKMHACGHDVHMTFLLGAARILSEHKDLLYGNIVFLFQPSEERYGGAERMINEGVLENPHVDVVFGMHVWPLPSGTIVSMGGPIMAQPDAFQLKVTGLGGHGAMPYLSLSPILPISRIVSAFNDITALYTSPHDPVVISVCQLHAGSSYNVIPGEAFLEGTIRTLNKKVREELIARMTLVAENICKGYSVKCEFKVQQGYPMTINNNILAEWCFKLLKEQFPEKNVLNKETPAMTGEDFSYFGQVVPSLFLWIGVQNVDRPAYMLHHPCFTVDEQEIASGIAYLCCLVARYTSSGQN